MVSCSQERPFWTQINADFPDLLGSILLLAKEPLTEPAGAQRKGKKKHILFAVDVEGMMS